MHELDNFLTTYKEYTKGHESNKDFHKWCALSLLSAATQRNLYIRTGYKTTYPNLYVLLIAISGKGKSAAIEIANDIYDLAFITDKTYDVLDSKISDSQLITFTNKIQNINDVASAYIIADEFAAAIGNAKLDPSLVIMFTKGYDVKNLTNITYDRQTEVSYKCFLNILAGSTLAWIKKCLPVDAAAGGFIARFIGVCRDTKEVTDPFANEVDFKLQKKLANYLRKVRKLKGSFKWSPEAKNWYTAWKTKHEKQENKIIDEFNAGFFSRYPMYIIKFAMLFSLADNFDLVITPYYLKQAEKLLGETDKFMNTLLGKLKSTDFGEFKERILKYIKQKKFIHYSDILKRFSSEGHNANTISNIIKCLVDEESIDKVSMGNKDAYKVHGKKE